MTVSISSISLSDGVLEREREGGSEREREPCLPPPVSCQSSVCMFAVCVYGWFRSDSPAAERSGAHIKTGHTSLLPPLDCGLFEL